MQTMAALFNGTTTSVLSVLYNNPDKQFHVSEIIRTVNSGSGATQRAIDKLAKAEIITRSEKGNRVFYRANRENDFYKGLSEMMTWASLENYDKVLTSSLAPVKDKIESAFVFGSVAKKTAGPKSDIDLMIVGDLSFKDLVAPLEKAEAKLHREINPVLYSKEDFESQLKNGNHFVTAVANGEKRILIGEK